MRVRIAIRLLQERFIRERRLVEESGQPWVIVSAAAMECSDPNDEIAPYDLSVDDLSSAASTEWAHKVAAQLAQGLSRTQTLRVLGLLLPPTYQIPLEPFLHKDACRSSTATRRQSCFAGGPSDSEDGQALRE